MTIDNKTTREEAMKLAEKNFDSASQSLQRAFIQLAGSVYDVVDKFVREHEQELLEEVSEC